MTDDSTPPQDGAAQCGPRHGDEVPLFFNSWENVFTVAIEAIRSSGRADTWIVGDEHGFAVEPDGSAEVWSVVDGVRETEHLGPKEGKEILGGIFAPWLLDTVLPVPWWRRLLNRLAPNRRSRTRLK